MRLVRVSVPDDQRDHLLEELDERGIDYMITEGAGSFDTNSLVEFPIPAQAAGELRRKLDELGLDENNYTVLVRAETAFTPNFRTIQKEYAQTYEPLPRLELRSKVRDIGYDTVSFLALMALSGVVAAVGLLIGSPGVVVGSMVIAPIIAPTVTAAVGAVLGDADMFLDSIRLQALGLGVAIVGGAGCGFFLRALDFVPAGMAIGSLELVSIRLVPSVFALIVGVAGGAAIGFVVTTDGSLGLVGVTVAAALVPAAAGTGVSIVFGAWLVAYGMFSLLLLTVIAINVAQFVTLRALGYRPPDSDGVLASLRAGVTGRTSPTTGIVLALALAVLVVTTGVVTANYVWYERGVVHSTEEVLDQDEYNSLSPTAVRSEYSDLFLSALLPPERVTVTVARTGNRSYPGLSTALEDRIAARTGRDVTVRVDFVQYDTSDTDSALAAGESNTTGTATTTTPNRRRRTFADIGNVPLVSGIPG